MFPVENSVFEIKKSMKVDTIHYEFVRLKQLMSFMNYSF